MKYNQIGRSMIEMLGVLAIIAVLSVGGIAGYSKAMTKFKTNQIADQVSTTVTNIKTLYAQQKNYAGLEDVANSMEIISEELGSNHTNPFGGEIKIAGTYKIFDYNNFDTAFSIVYKDLPREACIDLVTKDWGDSSGLIAVAACSDCVMEGELEEYTNIGCQGEIISWDGIVAIACPGGSIISVPMSPQFAAQACNCTGNTCKVGWKYY